MWQTGTFILKCGITAHVKQRISEIIGTKAFGKFFLYDEPVVRGFEVKLGINIRGSWKSSYPSIQSLLSHLSRFTQSKSSREKYLRHVAQFCGWADMDPEALIRLSKMKIESLVQEFVDELASKDRSRTYLNTVTKRLRTYFRVNQFTDNQELKLRSYFVPSRYRKVPEYIPTKAEIYSIANAASSRKCRAIILTLWSSRLRVSTLCALNFGDISKELEKGETEVMISVYPSMKERVADACKGLVPYYTFISSEACAALQSYLRGRKEKHGPIDPNYPLFHSDWTLWTREQRSSKRLGRRGIGIIVKKAAKLAGIPRWKYITPHCLRKAFETILISQTLDGGRLDKGTQEFFMGHILPASQDVYYDQTKVDFHRSEYSKLDFSRGGITEKMTDKLINLTDLNHYLLDGWLFVAKVNEKSVVVRRSIGRQ
jgi:integrase